ncbi:hypothetical protein ALC60_13457, partial [Trachymyrmex zeteki]
NRYARANNKYMPSYDPSKPSSYLMYYDVNNLYGWAMCQPLPYADFRWVDDVHNFNFTTIALDSPTSYILEVDLKYPLVAIELCKLQVKFNKPIYVGMCILDISKTCLYEFHHEYKAPLFRDKCKIMYTDTDRLIYHVECDDVYDIMKRDINRFDTSDYSIDNAYSILCDKLLAEEAWKRTVARDSTFGERTAATAVWAAMKAKTKLGMGPKTRKRKSKRILPIAKRGGLPYSSAAGRSRVVGRRSGGRCQDRKR